MYAYRAYGGHLVPSDKHVRDAFKEFLGRKKESIFTATLPILTCIRSCEYITSCIIAVKDFTADKRHVLHYYPFGSLDRVAGLLP